MGLQNIYTGSAQPKILVLANDKDMFIPSSLQEAGYNTVITDKADSALNTLCDDQSFDAILLGRSSCCDTCKIEIVSSLKSHSDLRNIPLLVEIGRDTKDEVIKGISAGVFRYLDRKHGKEALIDAVNAALEETKRLRQVEYLAKTSSMALSKMRFSLHSFNSLEEARALSHFLAQTCPQPQQVEMGLYELLSNAIEHGNLGIGSAQKNKLIQDNKFYEEIDNRMQHQVYGMRSAIVQMERRNNEINFMIQDEGDGFNWHPYMTDSPTIEQNFNGRGIFLARSVVFDRMEYQGRGNCVSASIYLGSHGIG